MDRYWEDSNVLQPLVDSEFLSVNDSEAATAKSNRRKKFNEALKKKVKSSTIPSQQAMKNVFQLLSPKFTILKADGLSENDIIARVN